jgi:fatty acid desaturase
MADGRAREKKEEAEVEERRREKAGQRPRSIGILLVALLLMGSCAVRATQPGWEWCWLGVIVWGLLVGMQLIVLFAD